MAEERLPPPKSSEPKAAAGAYCLISTTAAGASRKRSSGKMSRSPVPASSLPLITRLCRSPMSRAK